MSDQFQSRRAEEDAILRALAGLELDDFAGQLEPIGNYWSSAARMEHASIASFSRFSLELLALGAPSALVEGAHLAAIDEIHHARLSFAVASRFLGKQLGPGALPLGQVALHTEPHEVVDATVREGCVGETLAAREAEAARDHAKHPAIRMMLDVICRDEARHAELAWQTIAWAVQVFGDRLRDPIERAFERSLHPLSDSAAEPNEDLLRASGVVTPQLRVEVFNQARLDTIEPALRALFA